MGCNSNVAALLLCLAGPAAAAPRRLQIVATLPDLGALCREVAGPEVDVRVLLRDGEDPLRAEARPEQVLWLGRADLLVALGGPLEAGWLPPLLLAARNARLAEHFEAGAALRAAGSPPAAGYPLGDPRAAAAVSRALVEPLSALDPAQAPAFRAAAARLGAELGERERRWLALLLPLRGARVVSYDDSFRPLLGWAGIGELGTLAPQPGAVPTARRALLALRALRGGAGPRIILQREYEPGHLVRLLREHSGAALIAAPLGARADRGERYVEGMDRLVHELVGALGDAERRAP